MGEQEKTTAVAKVPPTVKSIVALPDVRQRFEDVLGVERARAYLGSLVALASEKNLAVCVPGSVVAAAFVAASLDLPIQRNLGFAWVVPYREDKGVVAQFQMGWKGYVQLALRTGQFRRLAAFPVNAEAFKGNDDFGEPIIDVGALDDEKDAVGYAVVWELLNGFKKSVYWTHAKCMRHAGKFSRGYKSGKKDNAWFTAEKEMCLKTVVSNAGRKWWPMSVQMTAALAADQSVKRDIDAPPQYIDGELVGEGGDDERPPIATPKPAAGTASADPEPEAGEGAPGESDDDIALNATEIGEALKMRPDVVAKDVAQARADGQLRVLRDGWAKTLERKRKG